MSSDDGKTENSNGGKKKKLDLQATKAAASGMAAVTAAVIGSELGWAGSVAGAGIASVVTTLAGSLYQQTLDRTKESVKEKVVARTAPFPRANGNSPMQPQQPPQQPRPVAVRPPSYPATQRPQHGVRQPIKPQQGQLPTPAAPTQPRKTDVNTGDQTRRTFAAIDPATVQLGNPQNAKTELVAPVPQVRPGEAPTQAMPQAGSPADTAATQVIAPASTDGSSAKGKLRWPVIVGLSVATTVFGLLVLIGIEALNGGNSVIGGKPGLVSGISGHSGGGSQDTDDDQQQAPVESTPPTEEQPSEAPETTTEAPETTTEAPETTTQAPTTTKPRNQGGLVPVPTGEEGN